MVTKDNVVQSENVTATLVARDVVKPLISEDRRWAVNSCSMKQGCAGMMG